MVEDWVVEEVGEGLDVRVGCSNTVEVGAAGVGVGYIMVGEVEREGERVDVDETPPLLLAAANRGVLVPPPPPPPLLSVGAGPEGVGEREGKAGVVVGASGVGVRREEGVGR